MTAFRSSPSYTAFIDAWQPAVWFQLLYHSIFSLTMVILVIDVSNDDQNRYRQWTHDLEEAFQKELPMHPPSSETPLLVSPLYEATIQVDRTLASLWHPENLLLPIFSRSVKTLYQLCARYSQWLQEAQNEAEQLETFPPVQRLHRLISLFFDAHFVLKKVTFFFFAKSLHKLESR